MSYPRPDEFDRDDDTGKFADISATGELYRDEYDPEAMRDTDEHEMSAVGLRDENAITHRTASRITRTVRAVRQSVEYLRNDARRRKAARRDRGRS